MITIYNKTSGIIEKEVNLTSNQILSLNSSPVEAIAAPGAGKTIFILDILGTLNYVSAAYATNTTLQLQFVNAGTIVMSNTSLLQSSVTRTIFLSKTATGSSSATQYLMNAALNINVATGNPTTGTGTLDLHLVYLIKSL